MVVSVLVMVVLLRVGLRGVPAQMGSVQPRYPERVIHPFSMPARVVAYTPPVVPVRVSPQSLVTTVMPCGRQVPSLPATKATCPALLPVAQNTNDPTGGQRSPGWAWPVASSRYQCTVAVG